jgi:DNA-binding transcriptional ArsR family regulator
MHALDVLGEPVRRRILEALAEGELTSGELVGVVQREFAISQPAVSQHLKVLRDAGFVGVRADGSRRIYSLRSPRLQEVDEWLARFRTFWSQPLDALATEIARGKRARRSAEARPAGVPLERQADELVDERRIADA